MRSELIDELIDCRNTIAKLEKENQDFLDTFQAIYDKLGLTEANVDGKELVSDTVKRRVDEIVNDNITMKFAIKYLREQRDSAINK